jgi:hypothetical protein
MNDLVTKDRIPPLGQMVLPILLHGTLTAVLSAMLIWCPEMLVDWSGGVRGWWPGITRFWWSVLVVPSFHLGHPFAVALGFVLVDSGLLVYQLRRGAVTVAHVMSMITTLGLALLILLTVVAMQAPVRQLQRLNPHLTVTAPWAGMAE